MEVLHRHKSLSYTLWNRAEACIPSGNMLLSKHPDIHLPEGWPTHYDYAKGCMIRTIDGKTYTDLGIMGIGTNILGYNNEKINCRVIEAINKSNMSSLNCPEEVFLAERLLELHSWADKVKFARTGGEANAIAVRIARAATGRDRVAICGYHGWHDWYLAANLKNDNNLEDHLMPGLEPAGVPKVLSGTVSTVTFNDFEELDRVFTDPSLAAFKIEVQRNIPPAKGYLEKIRRLCNENGVVLIFDECTSGFRETFGGIHLKTDVAPDMAVFGKALGNGFAITAVLGKEDVMDCAASTFISSTFWSERIGFVAGLTTLNEMEKVQSWEIVTDLGKYLLKSWDQVATSVGLSITTGSLPAIATFRFNSSRHLAYKTYLTQELLKYGFLGGCLVFLSTAHNSEIIDKYCQMLYTIFQSIKVFEEEQTPEVKFLEGPICRTPFKRLND